MKENKHGKECSTKPITVGIAGISGSGKSDIALALKKGFENLEYNTIIIPLVDYYKNNATDYNNMSAFDINQLYLDINHLVNGYTITKPRWDFGNRTRSIIREEISPGDFIIVEGIYALAPGMPDYDLSIFVKTDLDVCLKRRLERDRVQRQMTEEETYSEWDKVKSNLRYVLEQKYEATFVIYWNRDRQWGKKSLEGVSEVLLYKKALLENKAPRRVDDMKLDLILGDIS